MNVNIVSLLLVLIRDIDVNNHKDYRCDCCCGGVVVVVVFAVVLVVVLFYNKP